MSSEVKSEDTPHGEPAKDSTEKESAKKPTLPSTSTPHIYPIPRKSHPKTGEASSTDDITSGSEGWRDLPRVSIDLISKVSAAQQRHGFSQGDYQAYRRWCSSHLHQLRGQQGLKCRDPHNKHALPGCTPRPPSKRKKQRRKNQAKKGPIRSPYKIAHPDWNPKDGIPMEVRIERQKAKLAEGPFVKSVVRPSDITEGVRELKEDSPAPAPPAASKAVRSPRGRRDKSKKSGDAVASTKPAKKKRKRTVLARDALLIPLFLCERSLSYGLQLIDEYDEDSLRKRHSAMSKLRKSMVWCRDLHELCIARCDSLTILCSLLYLKLVQCQYFWHKSQPGLMVRSFSVITFILNNLFGAGKALGLALIRDVVSQFESISLFKEIRQKYGIALDQLEEAALAADEEDGGSEEKKHGGGGLDIAQLQREIAQATEQYLTEDNDVYAQCIRDFLTFVDQKASEDAEKQQAAAAAAAVDGAADTTDGGDSSLKTAGICEVKWKEIGLGRNLSQSSVKPGAISRIARLDDLLSKELMGESINASTVQAKRKVLNLLMKICDGLQNGFVEYQSKNKQSSSSSSSDSSKKTPKRGKPKKIKVSWNAELNGYLKYHSLLISLYRTSVWYYDSRIRNLCGKHQRVFAVGGLSSSSKKRSLFFFDFKMHSKCAQLCQDMVAQCDELSNVMFDQSRQYPPTSLAGGLSDQASAVAVATKKFCEHTRDLFDVFRNCHIAFAYYGSGQIDKTLRLLSEDSVLGALKQCESLTIAELKQLTESNAISGRICVSELCAAFSMIFEKAKLTRVACIARMSAQKAAQLQLESMESTLDEDLVNRLDVAFPVWRQIGQSSETASEEGGNVPPTIVDLDLDPQPVLPKPIMFDLAWNHIRYDWRPSLDPSDALASHADSSEPDATEEDASQPAAASSSWFGGLFS